MRWPIDVAQALLPVLFPYGRIVPKNSAAQRVAAGLWVEFNRSENCITVKLLFYGPEAEPVKLTWLLVE